MMRATLAVSLVLAGCAASHRRGLGGSDGDTDADGGLDGGGGPDGGRDGGGWLDGGYTEDVYVDPGCADAGPAPTSFDCDLYDRDACGAGMACYPFIFYPDDLCHEEGYGSVCDVAGSGTQDFFCDSAQDCAAGHACFQSREGKRCLRLCTLDGSVRCPAGLICAPTDVVSVGACF